MTRRAARPAERGMPVGVAVAIVAAGLVFCLPSVPLFLWPVVIVGALLGGLAVNRNPTQRRNHRP